jgi:hypothetical protein
VADGKEQRMIHEALARKARAWRTLAEALKSRAPELAKMHLLCADEIEQIAADYPEAPPMPRRDEIGRRKVVHAIMDTLKPGQWAEVTPDGLLEGADPEADERRAIAHQLSQDVIRLARRYWPERRYSSSVIKGYPPQIGRKL